MKGTLLAHNGCQDAVAAALETHGYFETVRRELREWTCDDADRILSWGPATEVDAAACFPELLCWVRALWTPGAGEAGTERPLVLALDPTHHRDEWVALVVGVAYRQQALPVAWHVVEAQARESWTAHYGRLLRQLAPAVPEGTPKSPSRSTIQGPEAAPACGSTAPARIPGPHPAYRSGHRVRVATDAHHGLPNTPEHPNRTGTCT